jgi:hypothetical protein
MYETDVTVSSKNALTNLHHDGADPDPTFHFDALADPDPAFNFDAYPDLNPAPHERDANLRTGLQTLHGSNQRLHCERLRPLHGSILRLHI